MAPFDTAETDRLLMTTKAVRRRLDLTRPVPRDVIVDCIRLGSYAPNASNAQEWKWIAVDDPEQRRAVGAIYAEHTIPPVSKMLASKEAAGDEKGARISRSILYLAEHMGEVPVLVLPCYDNDKANERYGNLLGGDAPPSPMDASKYASIYPSVWSFQLALRSRGLGSVLTTAHRAGSADMARVLGIPETWDQTCLIPAAYTTGGDFTPSRRRSPEDSIIWNAR